MMDHAAFSPEERVKRFSRWRIVEHWSHVAVFAVLICTGLSQKFYSFDVSGWIILHLGGIDTVRFIHRFAGIIRSLQVITHIAVAAVGVLRMKWQPTIVITRKDFSDLVHNIKYYFGLEQVSARGGRYTYRQKFEYWGILSGLLLMMFTGAILWFPAVITHFLPGEIVPAAKVLHTNHAFVVFLIIAIWHIYDALFSPEVFPLDTVIVNGFISGARMLGEHPDELSALKQEHRVEPPAPS
jgi:formate dehydrogenase subunit gamma